MSQASVILPDTEDLLAELAFRCPEIGPAIARVDVRWDTTVPTACVDAQGRIRINPSLADVAVQVIAHEVMHLVGEHFVDMPRPQYDPFLANVAGDIWLNGILQDMMPSLEWPANWFYPADAAQREMTARELYELIKSTAKRVKIPALGQGCGIEGLEPGEADGTSNDNAGGNPVDKATASAVMAGIGSILPRAERILAPPPPRSSIPEVMKEAKSAGLGNIKPRSTFSRLGRRSTPMIPRRGKRKTGPRIVVIVDISGSMYGSLDKIRRECLALAKQAKVHLILHDCSVLFSGRVGIDQIAQKIQVAGGTNFSAAFQEGARIIKSWGGQGSVVHFTDGEVGTWPVFPCAVPCYAGVTTSHVAPVPWRTRHIRVDS